MTTLAIGTTTDRSSARATGLDLALIRVGRALEAWGTRRAHRSVGREDLIGRHADARSTAAALAHTGLFPR